MELRTLEKMGFNLIVIDLATWIQFSESEKITSLKEYVEKALLLKKKN